MKDSSSPLWFRVPAKLANSGLCWSLHSWKLYNLNLQFRSSHPERKMKDSNTSTPSKCKTEMTPGWQNHRQGERVNLCLSLLRTHGRPLLQNFQIWSNAAYTLINHFHFDSVFNEQKRTRQCFCMNYIDNGPYGCGICADPTYVTHMRINPTYAEYADDAHRQMYPHGHWPTLIEKACRHKFLQHSTRFFKFL